MHWTHQPRAIIATVRGRGAPKPNDGERRVAPMANEPDPTAKALLAWF
jgi:hypothetical protein